MRGRQNSYRYGVSGDAGVRVARVLVVVWMTAVTVASLSSRSGYLSGDGPALHALAYLVLAWLLRHVWSGLPMPGRILAPLAAAVGFGGLIEMAQFALPDRTAESGDLLANGAGAAVGLLLPLLRPLAVGPEHRPRTP